MRGQPSRCEVLSPATLEEALGLLAKEPTLRPLAGGTDIMVPFTAGRSVDTRFLNLWGLPGLQGIEATAKTLILGALTTYSELREHPVVRAEFPNLLDSARVTGAAAIQNRGTLGGNIANGSPAADTPPSLLVYDADLELRSAQGARWISYATFHTGYKRSLLQPGELISRILLRRVEGHRPGQSFDYYRKVGTRAAQSIAKVCVAAHATAEGESVKTFRLALGAVAPMPLRARRVEDLIQGAPLASLPLAEAQWALQEDITPIDDIRSTAAYRRKVAGNLLADLLKRLSRELAQEPA